MREINRYNGICTKLADIIVHLRYTENNEIINTYFGIGRWQYWDEIADLIRVRPHYKKRWVKVLAIHSFINRCGHSSIVAVYRIKRKQIKLT